MSDDTTLQRYSSRFAKAADSAEDADANGTENFIAYGLLRGVRDRAQMLELRRKTGDVHAIAYSWIYKINYDPSAGVSIFFGDEAAHLRGRNLNLAASGSLSLLAGLLRHRVVWVCEADQSASLQAGQDTVVVEKIEW